MKQTLTTKSRVEEAGLSRRELVRTQSWEFARHFSIEEANPLPNFKDCLALAG